MADIQDHRLEARAAQEAGDFSAGHTASGVLDAHDGLRGGEGLRTITLIRSYPLLVQWQL